MKCDQFNSLSCYEEFEIQCNLFGISKTDALRRFGHLIDDYYFFVSLDGIFNWFDLVGNHIEDPGVLTEIKAQYIPKNIIRCVIPDSVTRINDWVFYDCTLLKEITIPNSVISIGDYAFVACKALTKIFIPNSVTSISCYAFAYCAPLQKITISDSITSIGDYEFAYCESLKEITIPDSVISIEYGAFYNCKSLKEISFKGKTAEQVKHMKWYPFGIKDESTIKCEV